MFSWSSKPMEPKPAGRESEIFFQLMGQLLKFLSQTEQLISGVCFKPWVLRLHGNPEACGCHQVRLAVVPSSLKWRWYPPGCPVLRRIVGEMGQNMFCKRKPGVCKPWSTGAPQSEAQQRVGHNAGTEPAGAGTGV